MSGNEERTAVELVFGLCHEIGNLLAACRMQANLLDQSTEPAAVANNAATISLLSSRMGSLVSLVRPILSEPDPSPDGVDPLEMFDDLQRSLDESCEKRVRFNLKSAVDIPFASVEYEPLHHLLLTAIYHALEDSEPGGPVRVSVEAEAPLVRFVIEGDGLAGVGRGTSRGRVIADIADAILRARGGRFDIAYSEGSIRIDIVVPAVG